MPTLNEEKTINNTLDSLKQIKDINYEIIISDGKSSDKTVVLAKDYTSKIIIYNKEIRQTISSARNLGASLAEGEFLLFLDADVRMKDQTHFLKALINYFDKDKYLVGATTRIKISPENATFSDKIMSFLFIDLIHYFDNNIIKTGSASGEIMFVRKASFDAIGGFNESLVSCEDLDLFERLTKIGKTTFFWNLTVYHSGRRFHKIGWFKLVSIWIVNVFYYKHYGRTKSAIWEEVR